MGASASVIQEYYKAVDYWADIAGKKDWKLAIWIVGRNDVDLVDKFLEIERSPVGQFDDIFFRFDTPYRGDDNEYAAQLWQEYAGWFEEQAEEKDDMLKALRHDGLLRTEYRPDTSAGGAYGGKPVEGDVALQGVHIPLGECLLLHLFSSGTIRGVSQDGMVRTVAERGCPAGHPSDNH